MSGESQAIRAALVQALESDLVGPFVPGDTPGAEQEILNTPPSRWYFTGFLAPEAAREPEPDDADSQEGGLASGDESRAEDAGEAETQTEPKRPVRFPASMGLSVFLSPRPPSPLSPPGEPTHADTLAVDVWFADYKKDELDSSSPKHRIYGWKRVPYGPVRVDVPLTAEALAPESGMAVPGSDGLVLVGELVAPDDMNGVAPGTRVLSLFLVNRRTPVEGKDRDTAFAFQVRMRLSYSAGFVGRPKIGRAHV